MDAFAPSSNPHDDPRERPESVAASRPASLLDLSSVHLDMILRAIDSQFPACVVNQAQDLAEGNVAAMLAYHQGQQSVLAAIRIAINRQRKGDAPSKNF